MGSGQPGKFVWELASEDPVNGLCLQPPSEYRMMLLWTGSMMAPTSACWSASATSHQPVSGWCLKKNTFIGSILENLALPAKPLRRDLFWKLSAPWSWRSVRPMGLLWIRLSVTVLHPWWLLWVTAHASCFSKQLLHSGSFFDFDYLWVVLYVFVRLGFLFC